jgi:CRISPR-associated exonuclease Cas4
MMTNGPAWVLLTLALALGMIVAMRRRRAARADRVERASRPSDLKDAELIYLEKRFDVSDPVRLSARLDRAYRMPSGLVVLVELKTRSVSRAFPSDVIQLSAQKLALERQTREVVAHHGYVVTQMPDGARGAHRVQLISGEAVVALVRRREAILAGRINPRSVASVGVCRNCAYRSICPDRLDRQIVSRRPIAKRHVLWRLSSWAIRRIAMSIWPRRPRTGP